MMRFLKGGAMSKQTYAYKVGGSLSSSAPCYVMRQADQQLYQALQAGEFCYIFNARQMGKSSLRLQVMQRLAQDGTRCALIEMTEIGSQRISPDQWYAALFLTLVTELGLGDPIDWLENWWQKRDALPPIKRLTDFLETVVLKQISVPIVIFVDEIDSVLSLDFDTDDFFALIRSCYEKRTVNPDYERLTFTLIGVATPSDLMQNRLRTPFNIGCAIKLDGFQASEIRPLAIGLEGYVQDPQSAMQTILAWTGGQPFLTQKVCKLVVQQATKTERSDLRDREIVGLIQSPLIDQWESQDEPTHFKTIRDRIVRYGDADSNRLLELYQRVLQVPEPGVEMSDAPEYQQLKLSGLAIDHQGYLKIHNPIYAAIFDRVWVENELAKLCPYAADLNFWLESDRQDESRLLRGNALQEALQWADERNISQIERKFLRAGLSAENNMFQAEKESAVRAGRILEKAKQKAESLVRIGLGVLAIALMIAGLTFYHLRITEAINQFEIASIRSWNQFEFAPLDMLQQAVGSARKFQQFQRKLKLPLIAADTVSPQITLQKMVDNIQEVNEIATEQSGINSVIFSEDNQHLITAGTNGTVKILTIGGQSAGTIQDPIRVPRSVKSIRYNKAETLLISGDVEGKLKVWQNQSATGLDYIPIAEEQAHSGGVYNVRFSPDEQFIATTGQKDGLLKLWRWDAAQRQLTPEWSKVAHLGGVMTLNFDTAGEMLATGGKDGTAKLWNRNGEIFATLAADRPRRADAPQSGPLPAVNTVNFCNPASCGQYYLMTGGNDGVIRLWDRQGQLTQSIPGQSGEVRTLAASPNGELIAASMIRDVHSPNGSTVSLWDAKTTQLVGQFRGHQGSIESIRFNKTGTQLVTAGLDDSTVRIWQIPPDTEDIRASRQLPSHIGAINSVRFSPDMQHIFTGGKDGTLRWWPLELVRSQRHKNKIGNPAIFTAAVPTEFISVRVHPQFPQVNLLAAADSDGLIHLLQIDQDKLQEISTFQTDQSRLESIDFNPTTANGITLLATTGNTDTIKLWEIDTQQKQLKQLHKFYDRQVNSRTVRFSPDGKKLAVGGERGQILFVNIATGAAQELAAADIDRYTRRVMVGFSRDSQTLVAISESGDIQRWAVAETTAQRRGPLIPTYQAGTNNIIFNHDGKAVITVGAGSAIRLWDLASGRQLADFRRQIVEFRGQWGLLRSVNLSQDGQWLATAGDNGIPQIIPMERSLDDLIDQGCEWLKQGYLKGEAATQLCR